VQFVDQTDDRAFAAALALGPKLIWIETPSNPLLRIVDIRALAQKAHAAGALVLVDNTFLSPVWQRPIALGADLVLHSTTKYLNGHSDVVGGAVIASTPELHDQVNGRHARRSHDGARSTFQLRQCCGESVTRRIAGSRVVVGALLAE
jgi:cystathionine gamma-synthase